LYAKQQVSLEGDFSRKNFRKVRFGRASLPKEEGNKVTCKVEGESVTSDIFVYAQGQDVNTLQVFSKELQQDLMPMLTRRYFLSEGEEAAPVSVLSTADERLKIIGASTFKFYDELKGKSKARGGPLAAKGFRESVRERCDALDSLQVQIKDLESQSV